ncbi:MAG: hypothetical protein RMJ56_11345 [Gemmataceae bacterium]|nr:hypothetical protein [Gemmata sp.]MDW8198185.1 hypothetical protein [Gemmataceae bacterium]
MQLFCPTCQLAAAAAQRCPRCGGLLLLPHETGEWRSPRSRAFPLQPPQPPVALQVAFGVVLTIGLYAGLHQVVIGLLASIESGVDDGWFNDWGEKSGTDPGLRLVAVVFGALIAAAGRVSGFTIGSLVGGISGVVFLAASWFTRGTADFWDYCQGALLVGGGGLAGMLATRVWGAIPTVEMPVVERNRLSSSFLALPKERPSQRPTAWLRIVLGAAVMVVAVATADTLRTGAQKYSGGLLKVSSVGQAQFLTWQIAVVGILGGGALAGASTGAGIRHGGITGVLGAAGVLALTAWEGESFRPVKYWLSQLQLGGVGPNDPAALVATTLWLVVLGVLGGWLGNMLFQPLAPPHMRQRLRSSWD